VKSEFDVSGLRDLPKVDIVYSYIEPSVAMVQALHATGIKGIVFAGTGAGLLSDFEASTGALQSHWQRPRHHTQRV
jgi:L-asparaginase